MSKSVSRAHRGAHKDYLRGRGLVAPASSRGIQDAVKRAGWPDENGLLVGSIADPQKQEARKRVTKPKVKVPAESADYWRELKSLDACAFNQGAERHFVAWLKGKISAQDFQAVTVAWVLSNAAFELDLSPETIKRYISKHTADLAEFHSDAGMLTIRKDG